MEMLWLRDVCVCCCPDSPGVRYGQPQSIPELLEYKLTTSHKERDWEARELWLDHYNSITVWVWVGDIKHPENVRQQWSGCSRGQNVTRSYRGTVWTMSRFLSPFRILIYKRDKQTMRWAIRIIKLWWYSDVLCPFAKSIFGRFINFSNFSLQTLICLTKWFTLFFFFFECTLRRITPRDTDKWSEEAVELHASQMFTQSRNQFSESMWAIAHRESVRVHTRVRDAKPINMVWNEKKTEKVPERFVVRRRLGHTALRAHVLTLSLHPLLSSYLVSMWMENFGKNEHWKRNKEEEKKKKELVMLNSAMSTVIAFYLL